MNGINSRTNMTKQIIRELEDRATEINSPNKMKIG